MNFFEPFVRRPVATTLFSIGIVIAGAAAFFQLPVAPLPQAEFPIITVTATMPGASPEVMASSVATPLERRLGTIAAVTQMQSSSTVSSTRIFLQFDLSRNIDGAARDVQAAISAARNVLPAALRSNPTYQKFDTSAFPVLILTLTSDTMGQGQLYDAAATILQQAISQVPGVGNVTVGGSSLPAVRVELNPSALFHYGIGLENVRAALAAANADSPKGVIESRDFRWQIYCNDQAEVAAQYRNLIVAYRNGAPVRLANVAQVLDSVEDVRNFGIANGQPAVVVNVSRQSGANIVETVDAVRALLPHLQAALPRGAHLGIAMDFSTMIRVSLRDSEYSLLIAMLLVILVVFAFLGDARATLIPGAAVPISIIGTFGAMYALGYSLDSFSLIALTIATGFVVDDAIVVMENIVRHLEAGMPRLEAVLLGVKEVGFTVLSMSLSLLAVFSPILFMGGIAGRFFHEFAATLAAAIVISMVISLSTTPMMCAYLLRAPAERRRSRWVEGSETAFRWMLSGYEHSLRWALRHQRLVLISVFAAVLLNFAAFVALRKGFFPEVDTGLVQGSMQADQSISFQHMVEKVKETVAIVQADPAVRTVVGTVGGGPTVGPGGGGNSSSQLYIDLKPLAERKTSAKDVIARLRPQLARVAGAVVYLQSSQYLPGGGAQQGNALYQYSLRGDDIAALRLWTPKLVEALKHEPGLADVNSDEQAKGLKANLVIDRDAASRLGLTTTQIDSTLYDAFGQRQVSAIYKSLNQYYVVMAVQPEFWQDPKALEGIYVSTSGGPASGTQTTNSVAGTVSAAGKGSTNTASIAADPVRNAALNSLAVVGKSSASTAQAVSTTKSTMIPLSAFARYELGTTPTAVAHKGQYVTSTISFNLMKGTSLSDAVAAIDRQTRVIHLPASIQGDFLGNAQSFQQIFGNFPLLLLGAIVAIYIVLGVLYESYAHPITILSTIPSASVGAFLALLLFNMEFDLVAVLGLFLLIGIVKKNAIMMIDLAIELERDQGLAPPDAILRASLLRFRPIMMTTLAALLGAVPLAVGIGSGAEFRRPLGVTIVGGLIVSQILTIYTTPVVYLYVDRFRLRLLRLKAKFRDHRPQLPAAQAHA